jgi:hypothetical protein
MKPVNFKTIPHANHRYPTFGDYWETEDAIEVRVSEVPDVFVAACLLHELTELLLLKHAGISLAVTDEFDIMFEQERENGKHSETAEPGDDPRCPYINEHRVAENIERIFLQAAGVPWSIYESEVNKLL